MPLATVPAGKEALLHMMVMGLETSPPWTTCTDSNCTTHRTTNNCRDLDTRAGCPNSPSLNHSGVMRRLTRSRATLRRTLPRADVEGCWHLLRTSKEQLPGLISGTGLEDGLDSSYGFSIINDSSPTG